MSEICKSLDSLTLKCCTHNAEQGHVDVLKAVVEVLQSSAARIAGGDTSGDLKEPSITVFTWGRFVKDVMNARTLQGRTPLMLACEHGCAALTVFTSLFIDMQQPAMLITASLEIQ